MQVGNHQFIGGRDTLSGLAVPRIRRIARLLAFAAVLALSVNESNAADDVLGEEAAKTIPVADAHFHVEPWMDFRELLEHMDKSGVRWAGGAGAKGGPGQNNEAAAAMGNRYIRPTGGPQWFSLHRQGGMSALENADSPAFQSRLSVIEGELRDDGARVIGEIIVNNLRSGSVPFGKMKADAPTVKALLDLAGKYGRSLMLHAQWDSDTAQEFQRLAESNPKARLILAHCGSITGAADIRALMEKYSNVVCDLSARSPLRITGRLANQLVFDRSLRGDWKKLIEDFPDRFVVGTDNSQSWGEYEATISYIRTGLLANLRKGVAEKVAYKNAQEWFGLE